MIPILFNKDEKTFTSLGLGQMDATLVEVERERNGNYTLYAEVPFNSPQSKLLTKEMLIKADAGSRTKWQTFKINRTVKDTNADVIKVYADHISMDTINDAMKPKVVITQQTAEGALRQWANNLVSGKAYDVQSDITHVGSTEWTIDEVENARQALGGVSGSILDVWGGEYEFDNNRIILHKEMGRTAPTVLEYGRNIVGLEYEELIDGVYTSIYPYATYTPKSEDNKQLPDIMVTLDELIVDSEYAGNYETRRIQIVDFSSEFDSNAENPEIPTQDKLRTLAKAYVKNNGYGIPKISQEIDFVDLSKTLDYQDIQVMEEIELNDRVPVYYPNIDAETNDVKVTTTNWDVLNSRYSKITLSTIGAMNTNSITSKLNTAIKDLKAEQKKINNTVPYLLNGQGNRVWHTTPDDNMEHKIGDTWFKKNGKYTIILKWNGSMWEEVLNDETFMTEIEAEVESAISKAEDAQALAVSEAEKALADANKYADEQDALITQQVTSSVDTAISTAEEAKQTAETSYSNAVAEAERLAEEQSEAFNKKFEENATEMSTLTQATQDADTKAQSALTKAGANENLLTTHQNTLDTIKNTTIPNVNKVATDAMSEAQSALNSASSAMDEAMKADGKIADYVTKNGLVNGTTVDSKIDTATGEISKKITTVEGKIPTEIGGRNLLPNTSSEWKNLTMSEGTHYTNFGYDIQLVAGMTYTFSIVVEKVNQNDTVPINLHLGLSTVKGSYTYDLVGWRQYNIPMGERVSLTYTVSEQEVSTRPWFAFRLRNEQRATTIRYKEVKLEKGSIPTDWTSAEEDNLSQSEFQIFESTYDEDVKGINSTLTDLSNKKLDGTTYTTFYNNEYKKTAQGVTDTYTKVNKIIDANGNSTDAFAKAVYDRNADRQKLDFNNVTKDLVTTTTYTAGIKGITESITTVEGKIPTNIGNRNYIHSKLSNYASYHSLSASDDGRSFKFTMTNANEYIVFNNSTGTAYDGVTDTYTFSAYVLVNGSIPTTSPLKRNGINTYSSNGTSEYDATTGRLVITQKITNFNWLVHMNVQTNLKASGTVIEFKEANIVRGTKPSDWSPAPEDTLGKADFQIFKGDYEKNDKTIKERLTAIDSSAEGSVVTRLNKTEKTASGNSTLITTIKNNYVTQKNIDDSILADKQILDTRNKNELPPYYYSKYPKQEVREFKLVSVMGIGTGTYGILTTNVPWGDLSGGRVQQTFDTETEKFTRQGSSGWSAWVKQIDSADTTYQKITETSSLYERVIGSSSEAGVKQNISRIVMTDSVFQTEVIDRQNLLTAMASGTGMTSDPYFDSGTNGLGVYDNGATGTIRINRTKIPTNTSIPAPKGNDGYRLDITHGASSATSPNRGGLVRTAMSWANGTVVVKFVALLPTGRSFNYNNNGLGTGYTAGWLTDNKGTGKWETYMYYYRFGSSGTFSSFGHLSITGATTAFTWYLSEYDVINVAETSASKITQLSDNINLKVSKADLISEINVSTEGVRIAGKNIQLDGNIYMTQFFQVPDANIKDLSVNKITGTNAEFKTMVTKGLTADVITSTMIKADTALFDMLFSTTSATTRLVARGAWITNANIASLDASKITSGTIATARLNASQIVTNGLSANVVKSTHIQGDTALIDKVFASEALIKRLTSKTAFISSIQTINLSASRITSGTLDASKVTVSNLDANSITGNKTSFVQSAWNGINSTVSINASGIRSSNSSGDWTLYHSGAISFGNSGSQGIYLEYADGSRNGLAINNRGALNTEITLDLMSSARNTLNFGRRTDTNGYDFRIDHYQGTKVSFDGRGVQRYTFNVNSDSQSHAISILGHGATSGYNSGSGLSIGMETADGVTKGSRFYFSSNSDLVWLGKNSYSDLKPLAVFDLQFRWGTNGRKSMKTVLEYLSRATGVNINNIPDV